MAKLSVYYAYLYSHLTYTIVVWDGMLTDSKIKKLCEIQKECVRYITNANKTALTDPLFKKFKILKMKDIKQLELLKFGYGIDHKIHPQPILDLFKKMEKPTGTKTHKYNTRQKNMPNVLPHTNTPYNQSYMCKSLSQYHKLSDKIKKAKMLKKFIEIIKYKLI